MNSRVGIMHIKLTHMWGCFGEADEDYYSQFGNRVSKDIMCNVEGRKLIEFFERNMSKC
jgi:hypothetical protein